MPSGYHQCTTSQLVTTNLLSPHSKAAVGGWAHVFAASAPAPAHHMLRTTPSLLRTPVGYALRCPLALPLHNGPFHLLKFG